MIPFVKVRVELGGKSVCGMEGKPDSCLECSELSNCVLDNFYQIVAPIREIYRKEKEKERRKGGY